LERPGLRLEKPIPIATAIKPSIAKGAAMSKGKGGFKNIKLGKNVYRQLKRRGPPQPFHDKHQKPDRGDQDNLQKSQQFGVRLGAPASRRLFL